MYTVIIGSLYLGTYFNDLIVNLILTSKNKNHPQNKILDTPLLDGVGCG